MGDKVMGLLAICILFFFSGSMIYKVWTLGSDEDDYKVICLGGHEYWRANFAAKGFLAVKLTDEGKPSACELSP